MAEAQEWLDWLEDNQESEEYSKVQQAFLIKQSKNPNFRAQVQKIYDRELGIEELASGIEALEAQRRTPSRALQAVEDPISTTDPTPTTELEPEPEPEEVTAKPRERIDDGGSDFLRGLSYGKDYGDLLFGSALEGVGKKLGIESLVDYGLEIQRANQTELDKVQGALLTLDDVKGVGSFIDWAQQTIGQTLPLTATSIGTALLGTAAAPAGIPAGIAGLTTAALSQIPFFYGGNREAQKEAIEQGLRTEMSEGAAFFTAIPQSAFDVIAEKFQLRGATDLLGNLIKRDGGIFTRGIKNLGKGTVSEVPTEMGQLLLEKVQAGQSITSDEAIDEFIETAAAAAVVGESLGVTTGALGLDRSRYEAGIDELAKDREKARKITDADVDKELETDLDEDQIISDAEVAARLKQEKEEDKAAANVTDEDIAQVTDEKGVEDTVAEGQEGPKREVERTDAKKVGKSGEEEVEEEGQEEVIDLSSKTDEELDSELNELTENGTKAVSELTSAQENRVNALRDEISEREKKAETDTGTDAGAVATDKTGAGPKVGTEEQVDTTDAPPAPPTTPPEGAELKKIRASLNSRLNNAEKSDVGSAIRPRTIKIVRDFLDSDASKNLTARSRAILQGKLKKLVDVDEFGLTPPGEIKQKTVEPDTGKSGTEIDPAQMKLDFERKETAPEKTDQAGNIVTKVLEKAQEPVKGKEREDFRQASLAAGRQKLGYETDKAEPTDTGDEPFARAPTSPKTIKQIISTKADFAKTGGAQYERDPDVEALRAKTKTTTEDFVDDSDIVTATGLLRKGISRKAEKGAEGKAKNYLASVDRVEDALTFLAFDMASIDSVGGTELFLSRKDPKTGKKVKVDPLGISSAFTRSAGLTNEENALFTGTGGGNAIEADAWVRENFSKKTVARYEALRKAYAKQLTEVSAQRETNIKQVAPTLNKPESIIRSKLMGEGYTQRADATKRSKAKISQERLTDQDREYLANLKKQQLEDFLKKVDPVYQAEARKEIAQAIKNIESRKRKITTDEAEISKGGVKNYTREEAKLAKDLGMTIKEFREEFGEGETESLTGEVNFLGPDGKDFFEFELPANLVSQLSSPLNPRIVQALRQGDIRLALGLLEGYTDDVSTANKDYFKLVRAIAETFPAKLGDTKVEVVNNLKNEAGIRVAGLFDPKTNTIKLDSKRGLNSHVLLHELTHALTSATLGNKSNPVTKALKKLFEETRGLLDTTYGTSSLDEFVAEAFSNMEFRSKLAGLYPKNSASSAFTKFKNQIFRMLNSVLTKINIKAIELDPEVDASETILSNVGRLAEAIMSPAPKSRNATELAADPEKIVDNLEDTQKAILKDPSSKKQFFDGLSEFFKTGSTLLKRVMLASIDSQNMIEVSNYFAGKKTANLAAKLWDAILRQRGSLQAKDDIIDGINKKHKKWYAGAGEKGKRLLDRLIYDLNFGATITQVDPLLSKSEAIARYASDKNKIKVLNPDGTVAELSKIDIWNKQQQIVKALINSKHGGMDGMTVYREMRDFYRQQYLDMEKAVLTQLEGIVGKDQAAVIKKDLFAQLFDKQLLDVYFPLVRRGKYKVVWHSIEQERLGRDPLALVMVETEAEAKRLVEQLKADKEGVDSTQHPLKGSGVAGPQYFEGEFDSKSFQLNTPSTAMMTEIISKIKEGTSGTSTEKEQLTNDLISMFLEALPETSFAQAFQARKGTPGFVIDSKLAFTTKAYDIARQATRIKYARELRNIETDIGNLKYKDIGYSQSTFGVIKQSLLARAQYAYNPPNDGLERAAVAFNQFGFLQSIAFNVSSAVVQTFQTPFITYPYLAARYGWGNAAKQILYNASGVVTTSFDFGDSIIPEVGIDTYFDIKVDSDGNDIYILKEKHKKGLKPSKIKYLEDLAPLVKVARERGQLNRTFFQDAMNIDQSGRAIDGATGKPKELWRSFMGVGAMVFNASDRYNRQVAMVASYQLELDKLRKGNKNAKLTEEQMMQAASNAVYAATETNGGTFIETGVPMAKRHVGRVALMYKSYGFKMYYVLIKNGLQSLNLLVPRDAPNRLEVVRQAQKMFLGNMLLTAAVSGVHTTFIYGAVKSLSLLFDIFEGDENPDERLRQAMGEGWYKGYLTQLSGVDITNRLKFNGLLIQENKFNTEIDGAEVFYDTFGGVFGSTLARFSSGLTDVVGSEGSSVDIERGIEKMLPPGFSNMFKSGGRLAREGYITRTGGNPIYDDVSQGELVFQFFGFAPTEYTRRSEEGLARRKIEKFVLKKQSKLLKQYHLAFSQNDVAEINKIEKRIAQFNRTTASKYPRAFITLKDERASRNSWYKAKSNVYNGTSLSPKIASDIVDQIKFGEEAETED